MRFPGFSPRMSSLLPLYLALALVGCSDERTLLEPSQDQAAAGLTDAVELAPPNGPRGRIRADLRNIWPNEDGLSWTYRLQQRAWGDFFTLRLYPTADQVPPAPPVIEVARLLREHPIGENPVLSNAVYRMQFNGMKTTASGAVGQNLETTILDEASPAGSVSTSQVTSTAMPAGILHAISVARPDLAAEIATRSPDVIRTESAAAGTAVPIQSPDFLFGYAFEKTSEYIGSYGDLNTQLAWKYLEADLSPGSSFTLQLVPDLADDVFLHARVLRQRISVTEDRALRWALQVLYLIDFGVGFGTDENGNITGYYRLYSYGTVDYVPGVGPVASYERAYVSPGLPLDPGQYDQMIRLAATTSRCDED